MPVVEKLAIREQKCMQVWVWVGRQNSVRCNVTVSSGQVKLGVKSEKSGGDRARLIGSDESKVEVESTAPLFFPLTDAEKGFVPNSSEEDSMYRLPFWGFLAGVDVLHSGRHA